MTFEIAEKRSPATIFRLNKGGGENGFEQQKRLQLLPLIVYVTDGWLIQDLLYQEIQLFVASARQFLKEFIREENEAEESVMR